MKNLSSLLCLAQLVMLAGLASPTMAQVTYKVTELVPASGYTQSEANAINDQGVVVGISYPPTINWNGMATRWNAGKPTALGIAKGGTFSSANSINRNGVAVGEGDNGRPNAVIYSKNGGVFLNKGSNNSFALMIGDNGSIYGYTIQGFGDTFTPVMWKADPKKADRYIATEYRYIDSTGLRAEASILAANNAGQIVGYGLDPVLGQLPLLWDSPASEPIILPGPAGVLPLGINDQGAAVGVCNDVNGNTYPVAWSTAPGHPMVELSLFDGESYGYATAINNTGIIIGNHFEQPAVWIAGVIYDINSRLDASGQGWHIDIVKDINNNGVIVGQATKNGLKRAVILTPQ